MYLLSKKRNLERKVVMRCWKDRVLDNWRFFIRLVRDLMFAALKRSSNSGASEDKNVNDKSNEPAIEGETPSFYDAFVPTGQVAYT